MKDRIHIRTKFWTICSRPTLLLPACVFVTILGVWTRPRMGQREQELGVSATNSYIPKPKRVPLNTRQTYEEEDTRDIQTARTLGGTLEPQSPVEDTRDIQTARILGGTLEPQSPVVLKGNHSVKATRISSSTSIFQDFDAFNHLVGTNSTSMFGQYIHFNGRLVGFWERVRF